MFWFVHRANNKAQSSATGMSFAGPSDAVQYVHRAEGQGPAQLVDNLQLLEPV